jgi:SIT4-associating protein SAP185/190
VFGSIEDAPDNGYEIDIDGSPVVGDLLKITFVNNKVVPTILVRVLTSGLNPANRSRTSFSAFLGITFFIT